MIDSTSHSVPVIDLDAEVQDLELLVVDGDSLPDGPHVQAPDDAVTGLRGNGYYFHASEVE